MHRITKSEQEKPTGEAVTRLSDEAAFLMLVLVTAEVKPCAQLTAKSKGAHKNHYPTQA